MRDEARRALGVAYDDRRIGLRESLHASNGALYPFIAVAILVVVDQFQGYAFLVLGPEISRAIGVGKGAIAAGLALKTLAMTLAALPMAAAVQNRPRRALVAVVTGFAWSSVTLLTGLVGNLRELFAVLITDGASSGSVQAIHPSLLMDLSPPPARVRALSFYRAAESTGNIASPLLVAILSAWLHLTWRGVFLALGVLALLMSSATTRLRDPGYGRLDASNVRRTVRGRRHRSESHTSTTVALGFSEVVQRVFIIPTAKRVLAAYAVLGTLLIPLYAYLFFFLEDRWGLGPGARGLFFGAMAAAAVVSLSLFGPYGDRVFRRDPSAFVRLGSVVLGGGVVLLALSMFAQVFSLMVALFAISAALLALIAPVLNVILLSVVAPETRPHAGALAGVFLSAVGGFGGLLLLSGMNRRFGTAGAIVSLAIPGLVAALVLHSASATIKEDFDRLVDDLVESEQLSLLRGRGVSIPLLSCRAIDVSYDRLQVLFGVDFSVDEGERVALLGTNGAGKSTLLRTISGVVLPTRGSIRFRGEDITYLDAERRVRFGIAQVPGGSATFDALSVVENLRAYAFSTSKRTTEATIDHVLDVFPQLASRRAQRASTLSGGERQMLGLGQALILRPKLLLIDELSLGLSPKVVGQLLALVETISESGTAVVLVEQSVNIALTVVTRACFMEKGEMKFDGLAADLTHRRDLLRSVYLRGVAGALEHR